ncbi:MAG: tetratricopeptide repeat-containing sulfotransferase family protein, partial [Sphingomonadaceae bacterium]
MSLAQLAPVDRDVVVSQARGLLERGRLAEAAGQCERLIEVDPTDRDALYIFAIVRRYQQRHDESLALSNQLIVVDPSYGRAYQERAHCLREMGDAAAALASYQQAVTHNRALVASWRVIADLHTEAGRPQSAEYAEAQVAYLTGHPPELLSVMSFIQEGRYRKAENLCRAFLQKHGHNIAAMRLLAEIGTKFNSYEEAEFLLESCLVLQPDVIDAHFDYVRVLRKRQKAQQALEQATSLRAKDPENPLVEMLYANENLAVGNFDEAMTVYRDQLAKSPNSPGINLTLGHALKTVGQQHEAIEAYQRAYANKPDYGDAYWSLANLKTYRFADQEIAQMRTAESASDVALEDRYHLCFAIGKALEDRGDYAGSFDHYERGNRLKREELGYDWRRITAEIQLQIDHCQPALFDANQRSGCVAPDPIFVLGLPRAGSTLIEQILASHSQIEGTMELPNILALAHKLDGRRRVDEEARYPANLTEIGADEFTAFGEAYIRDTRIHRKAGTPFFIDKMPNNFRHIGLIHLILPNAKIIDARRGAMGCCFSGFKQLFAEGQEFTYGLEEIGHYYKDYVALMAHWDQVLPGRVLRVDYADVVSDLETQVRRMLDFCGLAFEDACVNFHQTDRAVRTASSEQVRQPIFTSGLDQWENYSPWLDPLREIL